MFFMATLKYERKIKQANNRIDALQGQVTSGTASLADIEAELDSLITWLEDWIADLIEADELARHYINAHTGYNWDFPWE